MLGSIWSSIKNFLAGAVEAEPGSVGSGVITHQSPQSQEALASTKDLLDKDPDNAELQDWYAFQLYCNQRYEEAAEYYAKLVKSPTPRPEHYYYLGNVYFALGRSAEAVKLWERVVELHPEKSVAKKAQRKIDKVRGQ